jgi:parvulin-like peptidyl-prolyl isomerase
MRSRPCLQVVFAVSLALAASAAPLVSSRGEPAAADSSARLARIGEIEISRGAFETEFSRAGADTAKNEAQARRDFLQALVNRHLLTLAARDAGWFKADSLLDRRLTGTRKSLMVERLKDLEIRSKIQVTAADIEEYYDKQAVSYDVSHILVATADEARKVMERLAAGEDFAALADQVSVDAKTIGKGGRLSPFVWGTTRLTFLRELETMKPGEVRGPFLVESGYHVIRLNERIPRTDRKPLSEEREFMEHQYRIHREVEGTRAYYNELKSRHHFTPNWPVIHELTRRFDTALKAAATRKPELTLEEQADSAMASLVLDDSLLAQPLATWDFGSFLVREQWETLREFPGMVLVDRRNPHHTIDDAAGGFIASALMHEARARGLDHDPEVERKVALQREKLAVAEFYRNEIIGRATFTEAEERDYFAAHPEEFAQLPQVRAARIQYESGGPAEEMEAALKAPSVDVESLAAAHQAAGVVRTQDREGSWFGPAEHPILFERVAGLEPGGVARVIDEEGYWSVLVLLERKEGRNPTFEEARESVQTILRQQRGEEILNRALHELRAKYPVWIDEDYLERAGAKRPG